MKRTNAERMLQKLGYLSRIRGHDKNIVTYELHGCEEETFITIDSGTETVTKHGLFWDGGPGEPLTVEEIMAVDERKRELGWGTKFYDGSDLIDEIIQEGIDIETLTGMSWEEMCGEDE